ncbi:YtxH domain-containing protein [Actinomadura rugatobispora]|uniref:YtxH domain-containing protein n=1 Tax=Actinomadura rugatobispora TaxID=1994 RepID=A0ABW1AA88_9ACTN|nr:hypothetical protein GCM10010200_071310 [Actinomadura rugatobispora]
MKYRLTFMAGAALGYVLGTRAGRERYEQIVQASRRFNENPKVQEAAEKLRTKGGEIAGAAKERVPEQIGQRMPGRHRDTPAETPGGPQREAARPGTSAPLS